MTFKGRPYGNKIKGTLSYDYQGEVGELTFDGQKIRIGKKKQEKAG